MIGEIAIRDRRGLLSVESVLTLSLPYHGKSIVFAGQGLFMKYAHSREVATGFFKSENIIKEG